MPRVSLLDRLVQHARATAQYNVYFGRGRDRYDVRGRIAHESLFNVANGTYRGPSTQQGYSPFTTWTRGLAWAMLGFAEQLEFLEVVGDDALDPLGGRDAIEAHDARSGARDVRPLPGRSPRLTACPYWDAGAPGLAALGDWGEPPGRSVQRPRTGRQFRGGDCRARACCGSRACWRGAAIR